MLLPTRPQTLADETAWLRVVDLIAVKIGQVLRMFLVWYGKSNGRYCLVWYIWYGRQGMAGKIW